MTLLRFIGILFIIVYFWISSISHGYPVDWLFGDMPYYYYIKNKDYIGLYKTIKKSVTIDFNPDTIKYNDIDNVCHAVRNSASEVYPILLNEQVIDDIKFLYRNGIYMKIWNRSNHIYIRYESIKKYVKDPVIIGSNVEITEKEFLEICEELKKENAYVK